MKVSQMPDCQTLYYEVVLHASTHRRFFPRCNTETTFKAHPSGMEWMPDMKLECVTLLWRSSAIYYLLCRNTQKQKQWQQQTWLFHLNTLQT